MKPYDDENCKCHNIVAEIDKEYPGGNWNLDEACQKWGEMSMELENNDIEFEDGSDENYCCTCPTCGNIICSWCI